MQKLSFASPILQAEMALLMFSEVFLMFDVYATNLMLKTIFILYAIVFLFIPFFKDNYQVYRLSLTLTLKNCHLIVMLAGVFCSKWESLFHYCAGNNGDHNSCMYLRD